jgi:Family of unknown function (DUF6492)
LKIASSKFFQEDFAVLLDTKNHFIRRVGYDDFISPEGRPYSHFVNYSRDTTSFPNFLRNGCAYFGVPFDESFSRAAMPTTTPLTMKKSILRGMLDHIEQRERTDILRAFFHSNDLKETTEFLLYYAFILKEFGRARNVYERSPPISATFFSRSPKSEPAITALLRRLDDDDIKALGIHRARFRRLSQEETEKFKSVWISAGLFADIDECNRFLSIMHAP